MSFLGRGARKGKAKLAPHLEPFAIVDVEFVRGRRSTTIISVERLHTFRTLSSNIEHRLLAQTSLSLLDWHTKEADRDDVLYDELCTWLAFVDSQDSFTQMRQVFLLGGFLLRFLTHLGYEVQLDHCLACKETILPLSYRWHPGRGGLVCSDCVQKDQREWFAARVMPEEVVKLLRFAREASYDDLMNTSLEQERVSAVAQAIHDLMVFHLPNEPRTPFWSMVADLEFERESV